MLSPRYLEGLADEIVAIYSQLETDILQQMAGRLQRLGQITDKTRWQAQLLAELGTLRPAIDKITKNYSAEVQAEIMRVWKEAMERNTANDNVIFSKELGRTMSENQAQALLSLIQKNYSDLSRLTLTTAQEAEKIFVEEANRAFMLTYSGAGNYNTAMKESSVRLAKNGITTVHYNNGKPVRRSIESAVRMNVLTAVNHSAANMTLNNCQQLGCDLVEVSAHQGARPEHAAWQGKVYSLSGTHPDYPPFSVCGLGSATGICGINCRHSFYPYFPDSERHYTQKDLDKLEDEQVEWEGEKLDRYEAEQKLRHIERQIRHYKREAVVSKAAGIDDTASRIKLGQWQAKARAFTKATGLKRDSSREYIGVDGAQPRGLKAKEQTGGASGGILDKSDEEQQAYAKRAYETIRKKNAKSDIAKVSKSSGLSEENVEKIRNHVFINKHNLDKGFVRFDPDPEMAHAWEALEQGRPTELDIMLLNHELEELTLMEQYGYSYDIAHLLANKKYPWEYKKGGGMTDDQIQADIEKRLNVLLQV